MKRINIKLLLLTSLAMLALNTWAGSGINGEVKAINSKTKSVTIILSSSGTSKNYLTNKSTKYGGILKSFKDIKLRQKIQFRAAESATNQVFGSGNTKFYILEISAPK